MDKTLSTQCDNCRRTIRYQERFSGKSAKCPKCNSPIRLPEAAETLPQAFNEMQVTIETAHGSRVDVQDVRRGKEKKPGREFGHFTFVRQLGKGGFGEVWEAIDNRLGRSVAIKLPLFPATETKKIARFFTEGRAAAQLRHPNVVGIYDAGEIKGKHYLVTELVKGKTLSEAAVGAKLSHSESAKVICTLARALEYAHSRGILHRDIKPQNILIDANQHPQILDFGLAKILEDNAGLTVEGTVLGTPAYMSPEQARGIALDALSDQYSLGATLYWLLTGKAVFEGPYAAVLAQVMSAEPVRAGAIASGLDPRLDAICMKSISKEKTHRYPNCGAFAADLDRFLNDEEVLAKPMGWIRKGYRWVHRHPWESGTALIAVSMLLVTLSVSVVGWVRANKSAVLASEAEKSAETQRDELQKTESQLRDELARLTEVKKKSEAAILASKQAKEEADQSRQELEIALKKNVELKTNLDALTTVSAESSQATTSALSESSKLQQQSVQSKETAFQELLEMTPAVQDRYVTEKLTDARKRMDAREWENAMAKLTEIPVQLRDWRWRVLRYLVAKRERYLEYEVVPVVKEVTRDEARRQRRLSPFVDSQGNKQTPDFHAEAPTLEKELFARNRYETRRSTHLSFFDYVLRTPSSPDISHSLEGTLEDVWFTSTGHAVGIGYIEGPSVYDAKRKSSYTQELLWLWHLSEQGGRAIFSPQIYPQVYASPLKSFLACDEREDVIVLMNQDHAFKFDFSDVSSPSLTFTTEMGNWQKEQPKAHGDFHPFGRYHAENSRKRIMSVNLRPRSVEDLFAMLERSEVESVSVHGSDTLVYPGERPVTIQSEKSWDYAAKIYTWHVRAGGITVGVLPEKMSKYGGTIEVSADKFVVTMSRECAVFDFHEAMKQE